jgi:DNA polymerase-3 subunit alpha
MWHKIEVAAAYQFNASHAYAYSLIGFQSMWLKKHYPAEFYAASLSILDTDKLPGLIKEAEENGVFLAMPDINHSTNEFLPTFSTQRNRWELFVPFNRIDGIGDKTGAAIVDARRAAGGRFTDVAQFLSLVPKRSCNVRHQQILSDVGAYDSLLPPATPIDQGQRKRDLIRLLPGIARHDLDITRGINNDQQTKALLHDKVVLPIMGDADTGSEGCKRCSFAGEPHVPPRHGRSAKAMIITDGPTYGEQESQMMAEGLGSEYLRTALEVNGLSVADFYFTTLVKSKRPKGQSQYKNEQLNACADFLQREIDILRPQLIVACGGATIRHLIKGIKGSAEELVGTVNYLSDKDIAVVGGLNPQMIYIRGEKQADLNAVFAKVANMLGVQPVAAP